MPILTNASEEEVARLLALFPVARLRAAWGNIESETKEVLCEKIAASATRPQIATFVDSTFGVCKQHIYLFTHAGAPQLPGTMQDGQRIKHRPQSALYIVESITDVVQLDPYEDASIRFLWPIRVDIIDAHVAVKFVVLEKNIDSYFERQTLTRSHGVAEETILSGIIADMMLLGVDIHKGMKHLWNAKFMDCYVTKYKKSKSSAVETVNRGERKGIRENDPELFKLLMKSEMRSSLFSIEDANAGVSKVSIDPSAGRLAFLQYSANEEAVDDVVRKILQNN